MLTRIQRIAGVLCAQRMMRSRWNDPLFTRCAIATHGKRNDRQYPLEESLINYIANVYLYTLSIPFFYFHQQHPLQTFSIYFSTSARLYRLTNRSESWFVYPHTHRYALLTYCSSTGNSRGYPMEIEFNGTCKHTRMFLLQIRNIDCQKFYYIKNNMNICEFSCMYIILPHFRARAREATRHSWAILCSLDLQGEIYEL